MSDPILDGVFAEMMGGRNKDIKQAVWARVYAAEYTAVLAYLMGRGDTDLGGCGEYAAERATEAANLAVKHMGAVIL